MRRQPFSPRRQLKVEPAGGGGRPFAKFLAYEVRPYAATHLQATPAFRRFPDACWLEDAEICLQGCFQICLSAVGSSPSQPEALQFVQSRCAVLKSGFGLSGNMLPVAAQENEPPLSVDVEWYVHDWDKPSLHCYTAACLSSCTLQLCKRDFHSTVDAGSTSQPN